MILFISPNRCSRTGSLLRPSIASCQVGPLISLRLATWLNRVIKAPLGQAVSLHRVLSHRLQGRRPFSEAQRTISILVAARISFKELRFPQVPLSSLPCNGTRPSSRSAGLQDRETILTFTFSIRPRRESWRGPHSTILEVTRLNSS